MYKKYLLLILIVSGIFAVIFFPGSEQKQKVTGSYSNITSEQLSSAVSERDIFLLDVHIPEQAHIPGTDSFIDYRQLDENSALLPADKNTEIVVYCRSGNMSELASAKLVEMGYTNVKNLTGGTNSWLESGFEVDQNLIGSFN